MCTCLVLSDVQRLLRCACREKAQLHRNGALDARVNHVKCPFFARSGKIAFPLLLSRTSFTVRFCRFSHRAQNLSPRVFFDRRTLTMVRNVVSYSSHVAHQTAGSAGNISRMSTEATFRCGFQNGRFPFAISFAASFERHNFKRSFSFISDRLRIV